MALILPSYSSCTAPSDVEFVSLGDIDRLGSAFCEGQGYRFPQAVQKYREFRLRCLQTTLSIVEATEVPARALVSVRLKRLDSIRSKIIRPDSQFSLGRMDDVIGVRIICENYKVALELSQRIQSLPDNKLKNYITHPRNTGYRSLHHIMWFDQPLTDKKTIRVRFEIQVRSYYQHLWAIWSEHRDEKIIKTDKAVSADLLAVSKLIEQWEESNPEKMQRQLPGYIAGGHNIVLAWRQQHGLPNFLHFNDEVEHAVKWLNHLENKYPDERMGALLLVGVTSSSEIAKVLQLTHPLYTETDKPKDWMPPELGVFVTEWENSRGSRFPSASDLTESGTSPC